MTGWIDTHPDLALGIIGPILVAIGYFYRTRAEKHENRREALYLLLEIWHRMTIVSKRSFDELFETVFSRMQAKLPQYPISDEEQKVLKSYFTPILIRALRSNALEDVETLHDAYAKAVALISKSDPILAYCLDSASSTKKRLSCMDDYLAEAFKPFDQQNEAAAALTYNLRDGLSTQAEKDATKDIEKSLRNLALHVSVYTYVRVCVLIFRRHRKLISPIEMEHVDHLLDEVIIPALGDLKKWFKQTVSPTPQSIETSPCQR